MGHPEDDRTLRTPGPSRQARDHPSPLQPRQRPQRLRPRSPGRAFRPRPSHRRGLPAGRKLLNFKLHRKELLRDRMGKRQIWYFLLSETQLHFSLLKVC